MRYLALFSSTFICIIKSEEKRQAVDQHCQKIPMSPLTLSTSTGKESAYLLHCLWNIVFFSCVTFLQMSDISIVNTLWKNVFVKSLCKVPIHVIIHIYI